MNNVNNGFHQLRVVSGFVEWQKSGDNWSIRAMPRDARQAPKIARDVLSVSHTWSLPSLLFSPKFNATRTLRYPKKYPFSFVKEREDARVARWIVRQADLSNCRIIYDSLENTIVLFACISAAVMVIIKWNMFPPFWKPKKTELKYKYKRR